MNGRYHVICLQIDVHYNSGVTRDLNVQFSRFWIISFYYCLEDLESVTTSTGFTIISVFSQSTGPPWQYSFCLRVAEVN